MNPLLGANRYGFVVFPEIVEESRAIVAAVRLCPQVEEFRLGCFSVQLREGIEEALKDVPCGSRCQVCGGKQIGINVRVPAVYATESSVLLLSGIRIKSACLLFGIREADTQRLRDEQHV